MWQITMVNKYERNYIFLYVADYNGQQIRKKLYFPAQEFEIIFHYFQTIHF